MWVAGCVVGVWAARADAAADNFKPVSVLPETPGTLDHASTGRVVAFDLPVSRRRWIWGWRDAR